MGVTKGDVLRHKRLALRLPDYNRVYEYCYHNAMRPHEDDARAWQRARTTAEDLKDRDDQAMATLSH